MHVCSCGGPSGCLSVLPAIGTNCTSRILSENQESAGNNGAGYNNGCAISRSRDFGLAGSRAMLEVAAADSRSVGAEPHLQKPGRTLRVTPFSADDFMFTHLSQATCHTTTRARLSARTPQADLLHIAGRIAPEACFHPGTNHTFSPRIGDQRTPARIERRAPPRLPPQWGLSIALHPLFSISYSTTLSGPPPFASLTEAGHRTAMALLPQWRGRTSCGSFPGAPWISSGLTTSGSAC